MAADSIYQFLSIDLRDWFLTSGIDIHDGNVISLVEGSHEVIKQCLGPAVSMRLEHRDDAPVPPGTGRRQGRLDFDRMMAVVINNHDPLRLALDLKPAPDTAEVLEDLGDRRELHIQLHSDSNRSQGIQNVVPAGHANAELAELISPAVYFESCAVTFVDDFGGLEIGLAGQAVSHQAFPDLGDHPLQVLIIETKYDQPVERHLVDKIDKGCANLIDIFVVVEMILVDIGDHGDGR